MAWIFLLLAGFLEIGWAVGLKLGAGAARPLLGLTTLVCLLASVGLLGVALRHLPLGTAYAVWVGIGVVGTATVGIAALGETADLPRLSCLAAIVAGVAGLKLLS